MAGMRALAICRGFSEKSRFCRDFASVRERSRGACAEPYQIAMIRLSVTDVAFGGGEPQQWSSRMTTKLLTTVAAAVISNRRRRCAGTGGP